MVLTPHIPPHHDVRRGSKYYSYAVCDVAQTAPPSASSVASPASTPALDLTRLADGIDKVADELAKAAESTSIVEKEEALDELTKLKSMPTPAKKMLLKKIFLESSEKDLNILDEIEQEEERARADTSVVARDCAATPKCVDGTWRNSFGHTCADLEKDPHAKPDWVDTKGVTAGSACCKFCSSSNASDEADADEGDVKQV